MLFSSPGESIIHCNPFNVQHVCFFTSDMHMYIGQAPVYSAPAGSMAPAEVQQAYQNTASGQAGLTQNLSYSCANPTDPQQSPYPEKALL